jgi:hypothetical protein
MLDPQGIPAASRQPEATRQRQTERNEPDAAVFVECRHELRSTSQNACRAALDLSVFY